MTPCNYQINKCVIVECGLSVLYTFILDHKTIT